MKRFLLFLISICSAFLLNACAGGGGSTTPPPAGGGNNGGGGNPATQLSVTAPSAAPVAGTPFKVTVSALDASGSLVSTYSGTVHFTSSDSQAVLPANSTLINGRASFSATLNTAGSQTITATDTAVASITGSSISINVTAPLAISPTPPPPGVLDTAYPRFTFTTTGSGISPLVWSETGALPPGMAFNAGVLSGTPTVANTFPITVTVTDQSVPPQTDSKPFNIVINNPPKLVITTPPPLPGGTAGVDYFAEISALGGVQPYTFALATGSNQLPAGLTFSSAINRHTGGRHGVISGMPTTAGTTGNIIVQVSDSQTPPATATMTYSITIAPPLPLVIGTTSPLPSAGVGIPYNGFISATGGVRPYTFSLGAGSNPLPNGLSLTSQPNVALIPGIPTATGTTKNIIVDLTDSQTPPATTSMTYSLTVYPSAFYVGTQAPGDVWQLGISHASTTDGIFGFQDQGSNGLTGPLSGTGSQPFLTMPNGFIGLFSFGGTAVEMPGEMVLLTPSADTNSPSSSGQVIAAVANSCPQLLATTKYQFVALAGEDFDLTKDAYGVVTVTQAVTNTFNFAFDSFTLAGATGTSNTLPGLLCDSNLKIFSSTNAAGIKSTVAFSASGLMVIDNGTGIPAVGIKQPAANTSPSQIFGGQYLGAVFYANDRTTFCPNPPVRGCGIALPATDFVGFGPGSATSISGGIYQNIGSDSFSAHGTNYAITLGTQTSPGLFTGGTFTIGTNTLSNFDAVVGQVNGKFVLFGVTLDSAVTPIQPYVVLLIQQ